MSLCQSRREGGTYKASDIVKAESSREDPRAIGSFISNRSHPRVNQTKQHYTRGIKPLELQPWQGCGCGVMHMLAYVLSPWLGPFSFPPFTATLTPLHSATMLHRQHYSIILRCTRVHPTWLALVVI